MRGASSRCARAGSAAPRKPARHTHLNPPPTLQAKHRTHTTQATAFSSPAPATSSQSEWRSLWAYRRTAVRRASMVAGGRHAGGPPQAMSTASLLADASATAARQALLVERSVVRDRSSSRRSTQCSTQRGRQSGNGVIDGFGGACWVGGGRGPPRLGRHWQAVVRPDQARACKMLPGQRLHSPVPSTNFAFPW